MTDFIETHNQITIDNFEKLLRTTLQALWDKPELSAMIPPMMVWGPPGVGKSSVIRSIAEDFGVGFIDVRLAQREPIDVRGLPVPDKDGVKWLISSEWPRNPASRGIILFDEITAADRSLQVAAYEFILDRRLGELYKVPAGWYICGAGNRITDRAVATTMSSALANRFLHIELASDIHSWCQWAQNHSIHSAVIGFLRMRPDLLFQMNAENTERGWCSPRSWERLSTMLNIVQNKDLIRNVVYGLIGINAGVEFCGFLQLSETMDDVYELMINPTKKIKIPDKADMRYAMVSAMIYYLRQSEHTESEKIMLDGFYRISLALPSDFAAMAMADAVHGDDDTRAQKLYNHPAFSEWQKLHGTVLKKHQR